MIPDRVDAAIVGDGLAGLAAATLIAQAGARVAVFEKSREFGGRARSHRHQGYTFNLGPHAFYQARLSSGLNVSASDCSWGAWANRGLSPKKWGTPGHAGSLGLYQVRHGKLARAKMFYFDPATVNDFLTRQRVRHTRDSVHDLSDLDG